jgi:tRNA (guanine37-N1)-methyltransferase
MSGRPVMQIRFVTLFPEQVAYLAEFGVVGRAAHKGLLEFGAVDPRDFTGDVHRTVDDRPYGGGPGMVMKIQPLRGAIGEARRQLPAGSPCVVMSAQGRLLDQALVSELAGCPGLVIVAGRYERLIEIEAEYEVSVGDYVLSGGELPALTLADAVARLVPGVLGDADSAAQDSFAEGLLDCPHYTRPEVYEGHAVPPVLISGDHGAIRRWRLKQSLGRTWQRRPDILEGMALDEERKGLLEEFIAEQGEGETG